MLLSESWFRAARYTLPYGYFSERAIHSKCLCPILASETRLLHTRICYPMTRDLPGCGSICIHATVIAMTRYRTSTSGRTMHLINSGACLSSFTYHHDALVLSVSVGTSAVYYFPSISPVRLFQCITNGRNAEEAPTTGWSSSLRPGTGSWSRLCGSSASRSIFPAL